MRAAVMVCLGLMLGLSGCAKKVLRPPSEAFVELNGKKASYRQWARAEDLCAQDAAVFQRDLQSMNELLAMFLERTSGGFDGAWGQEQIGILEDAAVLLPAPLNVEAASIDAAEKTGCTFEGVAQAKDLNAMSKKRLEQAPDLLRVAKARVALAAWKEAHPTAEAQAKSKHCAAPSKTPVLFHAYEDETSKLEWKFCDGAKVVASPGNVPTFQAPEPVATKGKKAKPPKLAAPEVYVELAGQYPAGDVLRSPKVPKMVPTKKAEAAPEPDAI